MNRLFITGDTHGMNDIRKLTNENFPIQEELDKRQMQSLSDKHQKMFDRPF